MIDWYNLLTNALWISGVAIILATLSYSSWLASTKKEKFIQLINLSHPIQIMLNIGGLLCSLGLAATTEILWQRILWIFLIIGFFVQLLSEIYKEKQRKMTQ
jgi:mannose/fructose/N-acetylgalactosamine-specific phosphotransferase system component IIC